MSASCLYDGHIIRFLFPKIKHFSILGNGLVRGFRCLRQVRLIHAAHLVPFELQPMLQVFLHVEGVTLIVSFFLHFHKLLDILKNTLSPVQIYIKENLE